MYICIFNEIIKGIYVHTWYFASMSIVLFLYDYLLRPCIRMYEYILFLRVCVDS